MVWSGLSFLLVFSVQTMAHFNQCEDRHHQTLTIWWIFGRRYHKPNLGLFGLTLEFYDSIHTKHRHLILYIFLIMKKYTLHLIMHYITAILDLPVFKTVTSHRILAWNYFAILSVFNIIGPSMDSTKKRCIIPVINKNHTSIDIYCLRYVTKVKGRFYTILSYTSCNPFQI